MSCVDSTRGRLDKVIVMMINKQFIEINLIDIYIPIVMLSAEKKDFSLYLNGKVLTGVLAAAVIN
jgi:hypothetical protein